MKIAQNGFFFGNSRFIICFAVADAAALVGVVGNEQGTGTGTSAAGNVFAHSGLTVSLCVKKERERKRRR